MNGSLNGKIMKDSYPNLIIDQILNTIKEGVLKPGDEMLSENELIKQFNVGRTSVREAIASLEYMNVIVIENGKSYINNDVQSFFSKKLLYHYKIDPKQHDDMQQVREILEVEFTTLAAQRATVNDIKHLRQIVKRMGPMFEIEKEQAKSVVNGANTENFSDYCVDFHTAVARATQNAMFVRIYDRLVDMMFFEIRDETDESYMVATYNCFSKILRAIEDKDYVKAANMMTDYMEITRVKGNDILESEGMEKNV